MHNNCRSYTLASLRSHDAGSKGCWRRTCLFSAITHFLLEWWQISWAYESNDYSMSLILGVYFESCFFYVLAFLFCRFFFCRAFSVSHWNGCGSKVYEFFFSSSRFFIVFVPASYCLFRDTLVVKQSFFFIFSPFFYIIITEWLCSWRGDLWCLIFHCRIISKQTLQPWIVFIDSSFFFWFLIWFSTDSTNIASTGLWLLSVVEGRLHLRIFHALFLLLLFASEASKTCCTVFCISKHLQL